MLDERFVRTRRMTEVAAYFRNPVGGRKPTTLPTRNFEVRSSSFNLEIRGEPAAAQLCRTHVTEACVPSHMIVRTSSEWLCTRTLVGVRCVRPHCLQQTSFVAIRSRPVESTKYIKWLKWRPFLEIASFLLGAVLAAPLRPR